MKIMGKTRLNMTRHFIFPKHALLLAAMATVVTACNGLFENIYYNQADGVKDFGFVAVDASTKSGTVYVDATSYQRWNYIDFHSLTTDTANIVMDEAGPSQWDIAIHRYDAKTNGAEVFRTEYTSLSDVAALGGMPEGTGVTDEWTTDVITVDMSHMMDGWLVYADSYYNRELSTWLDVDKSEMPPIYTMSDKVYIVQFGDGTKAALKLRNYMNDVGIKGFMTVDYVYPLDY